MRLASQILHLLADEKSLSIEAISSELDFRRQSVYGAVVILEASGRVSREGEIVTITETGLERLAAEEAAAALGKEKKLKTNMGLVYPCLARNPQTVKDLERMTELNKTQIYSALHRLMNVDKVKRVDSRGDLESRRRNGWGSCALYARCR